VVMAGLVAALAGGAAQHHWWNLRLCTQRQRIGTAMRLHSRDWWRQWRPDGFDRCGCGAQYIWVPESRHRRWRTARELRLLRGEVTARWLQAISCVRPVVSSCFYVIERAQSRIEGVALLVEASLPFE